MLSRKLRPELPSAPGTHQGILMRRLLATLAAVLSAEHGIGKLKPYMMPDWRGGPELALMQRIKAALDPAGIMNPGKVLP